MVISPTLYPALTPPYAARIGGWLLAAAICAGALYAFPVNEAGMLTIGAIAIAALLSGLAGFAFSAVCGAMLFQFRADTATVLQILLVCSAANQALSVWSLRHDIVCRQLLPYLAGGVPGALAGVWLFVSMDPRGYIVALGVLQIAYGVYTLLRRPFVLEKTPVAADVLVGAVGGLLGGFAASPGAPVSIWCGCKGWDKVRQRATYQPFILVVQLAALAFIQLGGRHAQFPVEALACVPAGLAGTTCALWLFRRMNDRHFRLALNLLLIASGLGLAL